VSATTQLVKSSEAGAATGKSVPLGITAAGCLLALLALWWWARSGPDVIVRTVAPYRVTHINVAEATMGLVHGNRSYVVRCREHCSEFSIGGYYRMDDAGAVLQYNHAGQALSFPIIEEQTTFDVTGGHG
jgi:hypothetical protein